MQLYYVHEFDEHRAMGDESEARHLSKAMRKHVGDLAFITPGDGSIWQAEILVLGRSAVTFKPLRVIKTAVCEVKLGIAVAPTKNASRIEELVEKGVELGMTDLYLIRTERTLRKVYKTGRIQRMVISAMKQCLRSHLPKIHEMVSYEDFLKKTASDYEYRYIGKIEGENDYLINKAVNKSTMILIGPEGDFTDKEFDQAEQSGYKAVKLSEQRLRTETAGIMAIAAVINKRSASF